MHKAISIAGALALSVGAAGIASAQTAPLAGLIGSAALSQHGDWRPGPGWDRDIDVRCASEGYSYNMCQVDTGRGSRVSLVRQISKTPCVEGRTWGFNRAGVWVNGGCEGVFRVQRRWAGGSPGPGPGPGLAEGPPEGFESRRLTLKAFSVYCAALRASPLPENSFIFKELDHVCGRPHRRKAI